MPAPLRLNDDMGADVCQEDRTTTSLASDAYDNWFTVQFLQTKQVLKDQESGGNENDNSRHGA